jgi:hypothetical protein
LPSGQAVASFETYPEAQAAVDRLVKADFPVRDVSIVGSDLKTIERVTGTLSYGRAAAAGAAGGAWFGIFFGLLMFIFSPEGATIAVLGAAVLIGAGFGMLFGLVSYALNRRRRDFSSVSQVIAGSYAIIVSGEHAERAKTVLESPASSS